MKFSIAVLGAISALSVAVQAHSWMHCTKYEGNVFNDGWQRERCRGYPRQWQNSGPRQAFGSNEQAVHLPEADNTHTFTTDKRWHKACKFPRGDPQNYADPAYPMATYRPGEKVTLIWPAKNHGPPPDTCGIPYPPQTDKINQIHVWCDGGDPSWDEVKSGRWLAVDLNQGAGQRHRWGATGSNGKGFKNCPDFCRTDKDKAACFGDFVVPSDLPVGKTCTFSWTWFTGDPRWFASCWEARIVGDGGNAGGGGAPAAPAGGNSGLADAAVLNSRVFDWTYYREKYPDLRNAFGNNKAQYEDHWRRHGLAEGRQASEEFSVANYKARYADLRNAFGNNNVEYALHYINFGAKEGRNAR